MITPAQLKTIHILFTNNNIMDKEDKEEIIYVFTNKKTTSSKEMSKGEAAALIGHLKSLDPVEKSMQKMQKKIISMALEMNWRKPGTGKIDMDHLNTWCVKFSPYHKKLDNHTYKELPQLVTQFEKVYSDYLKNI